MRPAVLALLLLMMMVVGCDTDQAAAPGADGGSGASCRELFGAAPVYMPCGEQAGSCSFYTSGAVRTCESVCADFGAGCAASYAAEDSCGLASGDQNCVVPNAAQICVCSR